MSQLDYARQKYQQYGVDVDEALKKLSEVSIAMHCWQGDDVLGFEGEETLSGGIAATGNHPGRARNPEELMADYARALKHIGGVKKINLHASYALTGDEKVERNELEGRHFDGWIAFARAYGIGIDFNPTFFSHPRVKDNLTLSSPDEATRQFWIEHGKASRRIAAYIAEKLGQDVVNNVWVPDGFKDYTGDRLGPRMRLKDSLDQIFADKYEGVIDCVESKVFGIGLETFTVGSSEFYLAYASTRPDVYYLMDAGHYHPTESISDKISSVLSFFDRLPLHVSRPVRWDSDHVVSFDDETRAIAQELVRCDALDKALIALDFFDASINRVAAWIIGTRNMQKALLYALLQPTETLRTLQDHADYTKLLIMNEELKTLPFGTVWETWCEREGVATDGEWYTDINAYEDEILKERT